MEWFNDKNRRGGVIGAILFHLVLLVVFMFISMEPPSPPPPTIGMEVNFGDSDNGMGDKPITDASQQSASQSSSSSKNDVITQNTEQTVSIKHGVKPKETPTTPKEDPKPQINSNLLFPGSKTTKGGSEGQTGQPGNQGKENGNVNSTNYEGNGGNGTSVSYDLVGRGTKKTIKPTNNSNETGKVVVQVKVDKKGKVISAQIINSKTKTTSSYLRNLAVNAAYQWEFDTNSNAAEEQMGSITFNFINQ